jgi:hypothetical protein
MSADFYNDLSELRCIPRGGVKREPEPKKAPPWEGMHLGKTWRDMPGVGEENRRLSFVLFRLGKLDQNLDGSWTRWKSARSKASLDEQSARQARTREVWPRLQEWITAGWSAERLAREVSESGLISRVPFLTQFEKPNIPWTLKMLAACDAFLATNEVPKTLEKAPRWWKHMPGADEEAKKRNFALWKEGKMQLVIDGRSPQQRRGHLTRRFVDEEPGAQELVAEVLEIAQTRGSSIHHIAREISTQGGISHAHAYGVFKGRYKLTVVMAKPIREWLAKQPETNAKEVAV